MQSHKGRLWAGPGRAGLVSCPVWLSQTDIVLSVTPRDSHVTQWCVLYRFQQWDSWTSGQLSLLQTSLCLSPTPLWHITSNISFLFAMPILCFHKSKVITDKPPECMCGRGWNSGFFTSWGSEREFIPSESKVKTKLKRLAFSQYGVECWDTSAMWWEEAKQLGRRQMEGVSPPGLSTCKTLSSTFFLKNPMLLD